METQTPNTPAELMAQNQKPLDPEDIWKEYMKLDPEEQEKFLWNGVRVLAEFHSFVVDKMLEKDASLKDEGAWVRDGVKWEMIYHLMNTMDNE